MFFENHIGYKHDATISIAVTSKRRWNYEETTCSLNDVYAIKHLHLFCTAKTWLHIIRTILEFNRSKKQQFNQRMCVLLIGYTHRVWLSASFMRHGRSCSCETSSGNVPILRDSLFTTLLPPPPLSGYVYVCIGHVVMIRFLLSMCNVKQLWVKVEQNSVSV